MTEAGDESFVTLGIRRENGQLVFVNKEGFLAKDCPRGFPVKMDNRNPYSLTPVNSESGVDVRKLSNNNNIPTPRIQAMLTETPETFRVNSGFTDPEMWPASPTIAMWLEHRNGMPGSHEF